MQLNAQVSRLAKENDTLKAEIVELKKLLDQQSSNHTLS